MPLGKRQLANMDELAAAGNVDELAAQEVAAGDDLAAQEVATGDGVGP